MLLMTFSEAIEEKLERFLRDHGELVGAFGALWDTTQQAAYREVRGVTHANLAIGGLVTQCAELLEEIFLVCTHEYGNAGFRLLRSLYERVVLLAFLVNNQDQIEEFCHRAALDMGQILHRAEELARFEGTTLETKLPGEVITAIKESYERVKDKVQRCEKCGRPRELPTDAMARKADDHLASLYGLCFAMPSKWIHPTFYSFMAGAKADSEGVIYTTKIQTKEAEQALRLAHWLILKALSIADSYFKMTLADQIAQRIADYEKLWRVPYELGKGAR